MFFVCLHSVLQAVNVFFEIFVCVCVFVFRVAFFESYEVGIKLLVLKLGT